MTGGRARGTHPNNQKSGGRYVREEHTQPNRFLLLAQIDHHSKEQNIGSKDIFKYAGILPRPVIL